VRGVNKDQIQYLVGTSGEVILLTPAVLRRFRLNRQQWWQAEAGGQLFASIASKEIKIVEATGPRWNDKRCRYSFRSDRLADQKEIEQRFERGLHYVGDWHTHPQVFPHPSGRDRVTMQSRVLASKHSLNGFIFVIIGRAPPPHGINLMVHDGSEFHSLCASKAFL
jgi:integrative and conjugative element protein (TIGR02256 family)